MVLICGRRAESGRRAADHFCRFVRSGIPTLLLSICLTVALYLAAPLAMAQSGPGSPPASTDQPPSSASGGGVRPSRPRRERDPQRLIAAGHLAGHGGPVKTVRIDVATGRALTGSFDYSAMLWDISGDTPRRLLHLNQHDGAVNAVAFLPGASRALTAGDDGSVWLWDIPAGKLVHRFKGHEGKINGLAVSDDGHYAVSASWDRTARIWDLEQLKPVATLTAQKGPINAAAFSHDGRTVFTAGYDGAIVAWDRASGEYRRPVYKHGWGVNVLEALPGSDLLVFGAVNGAAGILDPSTGNVRAELAQHQRPVLALAVLAKPGLVATGGGDGQIHVYRIGDWAPIETYQNPYGPIWGLAFAPAGAAMYYAGLDDFATRWQVTPRDPFQPIESDVPRRFQVEDGVSLGERQFARKCSVCHTLTADGANRAGPTLYRLFGRKAGSLPGYPYSPALTSADIVWNEHTIAKLFEDGPDRYTPGSKMPLQRITDAKLRDALIAYLKSATGGK
jgi:cytochrome c